MQEEDQEESGDQDASKAADDEDWDILLQEEKQEECRDQNASEDEHWDILLEEEEQK